MGFSPYKTRSQLLREKATGLAPEVDPSTQYRFDKGHKAEAAARPNIEAMIGEELFPATAISDDGYLSASFDGITMCEDFFWENKLFNQTLAAYIESNNDLPDSHWPQVEQQFMISKADKCLFTLCDEQGEVKTKLAYQARPERQQAVLAAWAQYDEELANYQHTEVKEMPTAEITIDLPALFVHARGEITTHNMDEFGIALADRLAETRAIVLLTDQDFSNAKAAAKKFRDTAKAIAVSKEQMLAQTETIGEAARKMDAWAKDLNATALQLEKDVEREDKNKKEAMLLAGKNAYAEHIASLESRISPIRLNLPAPGFVEAIKGRRNYASMQDAIDTALANAKIAANDAADKIDANLKSLRELAADHKFLFSDTAQLVLKPNEDLVNLIKLRISEHQAAEQAKADALREQIRQEEEAKAKAEAEEKVRAEHAAKEAREAAEAEAKAEADKAAQAKVVEPVVAAPTTKESLAVAPAHDRASAMEALIGLADQAQARADAEEAKPKRPTDQQIIFAVATQFKTDFHTAKQWILEMDFSEMRGAA
jgi:predicted phage-related endonuclease